MILALDHLQDLGTLINRCQEGGAGTILVPAWKQIRRQFDTVKEEKAWSPRLQALLAGWSRPEPTIAALVKAIELVVEKMDFMETKHAKMLDFFHHLSVVDPRNLATHVSTWAEVSEPLHMPPELRDEWETYATMDPVKAKSVQDVEAFWHAQDTPLALHIQQLLAVPTASDAVERSFSKAGVLDTKLRTSTRPLLRKACIMLFCNGDFEGRFSHS
uniref:HAT C-terminal dimerisation domain-containing protein n=1 Tax=Eutreptiella gymnastica TaxID=73025 RepID=A0A7S1JGA2_9EUGL|mmetsp:Transcript_95454/g.164677  ORF Transcript_95454/g.164677 Transcript_95454/m.164677 type:complete len:216 (+) Transcript_95454:385-1032(+)